MYGINTYRKGTNGEEHMWKRAHILYTNPRVHTEKSGESIQRNRNEESVHGHRESTHGESTHRGVYIKK